MAGLTLVASRHDLPPMWDGRRVKWREWASAWTTFSFHVPLSDTACEACGSLAVRKCAGGMVDPLPGETFECWREIPMKSGRKRSVRYDKPAWPILRLYVSRCPDCGTDEVWDKETDQWWTLDESDYGDDGSTEPQPETLW